MTAVNSTNKKSREQFLVHNAGRDGVITTASGLQYEVLRRGDGDLPDASSVVRTHYSGSLIDGTEFDSSWRRDKPEEFAVKAVIAGWAEALQLMPVGSKWRLVIPGYLAYGERGRMDIGIPPNATLVFEVELIDIVSEE